MDSKLRDYYKYQAAIMEPWDGPALVCFTDGDGVGQLCFELAQSNCSVDSGRLRPT